MGPQSECQICLQRDALSTPWGFRLQGGKDFKTPLSVQRVFVGSPADGELHRGDIILGINGYDAANMIHKQAQDLIKNAGGTINLIVRKVSGGAPPRALPSQSRAGFQPPTAPSDQGSYRSRPLDTFTPKPAPPIGSVVTNAHAPMNYHQPQTKGFVPNQFGTDYSHPSPQRAAPNARGQSGSMLNRVQNSLQSSVYGGENGEEEAYNQVPVSQLKQVFNQPQYAPQEEDDLEPYRSVKDLKGIYNKKSRDASKSPSRPRPRPASHSPGWAKPSDGDSGLPEPGWSPVKAPTSAPRYPSAPSRSPARAPPQHQPVNRPVNRPAPGFQQPTQNENYAPAWVGSLKSSGGPKQWESREQSAIAAGGVPPPHMQQHEAPVPVHQPRVQNVHYGPGSSAPEYQQQGDGQASDSAHVAHLQYNTPIGLYSKDNVQEALKGQTAGRPGDGTLQVGGPGQKAFDPNRSEVLRLLQEEERPRPRGHGLAPGQQPPPQQQQVSPRHSGRHEQEQHYAGYVDPNKQSPMMHALENQMANIQVDDGTSDF